MTSLDDGGGGDGADGEKMRTIVTLAWSLRLPLASGLLEEVTTPSDWDSAVAKAKEV